MISVLVSGASARKRVGLSDVGAGSVHACLDAGIYFNDRTQFVGGVLNTCIYFRRRL